MAEGLYHYALCAILPERAPATYLPHHALRHTRTARVQHCTHARRSPVPGCTFTGSTTCSRGPFLTPLIPSSADSTTTAAHARCAYASGGQIGGRTHSRRLHLGIPRTRATRYILGTLLQSPPYFTATGQLRRGLGVERMLYAFIRIAHLAFPLVAWRLLDGHERHSPLYTCHCEADSSTCLAPLLYHHLPATIHFFPLRLAIQHTTRTLTCLHHLPLA